MFILSSTPTFFMFSLASAILSSSLSIVSIFPPSFKYSEKHIAEYPTAVPISSIFSGLFSVKYLSITSNVSSIIIGICLSSAYSFIFSSSSLFILLFPLIYYLNSYKLDINYNTKCPILASFIKKSNFLCKIACFDKLCNFFII